MTNPCYLLREGDLVRDVDGWHTVTGLVVGLPIKDFSGVIEVIEASQVDALPSPIRKAQGDDQKEER